MDQLDIRNAKFSDEMAWETVEDAIPSMEEALLTVDYATMVHPDHDGGSPEQQRFIAENFEELTGYARGTEEYNQNLSFVSQHPSDLAKRIGFHGWCRAIHPGKTVWLVCAKSMNLGFGRSFYSVSPSLLAALRCVYSQWEDAVQASYELAHTGSASKP